MKVNLQHRFNREWALSCSEIRKVGESGTKDRRTELDLFILFFHYDNKITVR